MSPADFKAIFRKATNTDARRRLWLLATPKRIVEHLSSRTGADVKVFIDHLEQILRRGAKSSKKKKFFTSKIKLFKENESSWFIDQYKDDFYRRKEGAFLPKSMAARVGNKKYPKKIFLINAKEKWTYCILENRRTYFDTEELLTEYLNLDLPNFHKGISLLEITTEQKSRIVKFIEKYGSPEFVPTPGWDLCEGFAYFWSYFATALDIRDKIHSFPFDSVRTKSVKLNNYNQPLKLPEWRIEVKQGFAATSRNRATETKPPINFDDEYRDPLSFLYDFVFRENGYAKRCAVCSERFTRKKTAKTCSLKCKEILVKRVQRAKAG